MSGDLTDRLAAFRQQLLVDKKKTAVLAVLSAALLIIVGRLFVSPSTPAPTYASMSQPIAAAVMASPPAPDPTKPVVRPTPEAKPTRITAEGGYATLIPPTEPALWHGRPAREHTGETPVPPPQNSEATSASPGAPGRLVAVDDLPRVLERNLFSTNGWSKFPSAGRFGMSPGEADGAGSAAKSSDGVWRHLTNVLGQYQETRKGELERVDGELAALQLQSTVTGSTAEGGCATPTPMAYISGRLVREGDIIEGFTVLHIRERRVTIRKFGLTRELRMP